MGLYMQKANSKTNEYPKAICIRLVTFKSYLKHNGPIFRDLKTLDIF